MTRIFKFLQFVFCVLGCAFATYGQTMRDGIELKEVIVRPGKEKYTKKNNPAVALADSLRMMSDKSNPRARDFYNYDKYECITISLNDVSDSIGGGVAKKFGFLSQYVDTASLTGKAILPLSTKEKVSEIHFRRQPKSEKEYVNAIRRNGIDDIINQQNVQTYLEDIFREVDLYDNDITLLSNRFVSPLSSIGPDFYKYYLTDTVEVANERCAVLSFVPRNNATFGFTGRIFVPIDGDNSFIKRVEMGLAQNANVNFVKSLAIIQTYERGPGESRIKNEDILSIEFEIVSGTPGLYVQRLTRLFNHNFEPSTRPELFDRGVESITSASAFLQPDDFWIQYRKETFGVPGKDVAELMANLRDVKIYRIAEQALKILVGGYVRIGSRSQIYLGPVNTLLSFNDVEGTRFRVGGLTTATLNPHWFGNGYLAYGTKDRKLKYKAEIEYSFRKKTRHAREFPVHSLRLSHKYDIDHLGQDYAFTNADNFFLSLKRTKDTLAIYKRESALNYTLELENNFSAEVRLAALRYEPTRFVRFEFGDRSSLSHINFNELTAAFRYAPGEKFYQTSTQRIPANYDAPVFLLRHTFAPSWAPGNRFSLNKTEFNFQKRFWFSSFGYADVILKAAHIWDKTLFLNLLSPNSNISYTIQPESFDLVNPMEFLNDTQVSAFLTYWGNGVIFNYIPYVKQLRLREVFAFRAAWGTLSSRNNPDCNSSLPAFPNTVGPRAMRWGEPYMEVAVGLDNIFKILQLNYVWRLTYRANPGISRSGLRVALHFNF